MDNIKRNTTFRTLKRSATSINKNIQNSKSFKTIKRSGTQAWKWVNAEDTTVSQNKPVGISYFQRNDTVRKLNRQTDGKLLSRTLTRRPTAKNNLRARPRPTEASPLHASDSKHNKDAYYVNLEDDGVYSNDQVSSSKPSKPSKDDEKPSHIPSVLFDPEVRKQLEAMHPHKPIFMYAVTIIQILTFVISLIINMKNTGSPIAPISRNVMIGPEGVHMIHMGARFAPCMKPMNLNATVFECVGVKNAHIMEGKNVCYLNEMCGMGMESEDVPNQWYRFFTAIFLHCGLLHIIFNLIFQIRTGVDMEKDFGTWRIAIIYIATGVFGFAFGAYNSQNTSVGCSGSLYGLIGCLLLDLIQSWKIITNPWRELAKMIIIIIASLAIGLISFIDNSAHVGGFISGILTGLIFLPTISFSKTDLRIKRGAMIISIFVTIYAFYWVFKTFYSENGKCSWCKYINCIDYSNWCDAYK